ncbi:hypothetical protein EBT23_05985 [bacterium]|nr:hypothetical protein [bacterium]
MKNKSIKFLGFCLLLSSASLVVGQTVSTPVVGFSKESLPSGQHFFAPSFIKPAVYSGTATISGSSVTGLTLSGSLGLTSFSDRPNFPTHYLEITSGSYAGTYYDISSNTSNSASLAQTPNTSGSVTVVIRPHVTLGDVIKADSGIGEYSDSISVYDNSGNFASYYFAGGMVTGDDFATPMGHVPVPPGKGIGINLGGNIQITNSGQVRNTALNVPVYPGAVNVVGMLNPSGATKLTSLTLGQQLDAYSESATLYDSSGSLALVAIAYSDGQDPTDDTFTPYNSTTSPSVQTKGTMLVNVGSAKYITVPPATN